jgi:hypothetical protein
MVWTISGAFNEGNFHYNRSNINVSVDKDFMYSSCAASTICILQ